MRRTIAATVVTAVLMGALVVAVPAATATPRKAKCSSCHAASSKVKIKLTRTSETTDTATYSIKVTGGKGTAGWAVFQGTKNLKHATKATGSFTATIGATYTFRAVKKKSGSAAKKLTVP